MSEEEDFSKLPVEAKWRHAKWKARQSAFEDVITGLKRGTVAYKPSVEDLRLCASDANVIALEAGIKVVTAVLQSLPAESREPVAIRQSVARPLAEKGLVAAKPAVKQAAMEALLALVEVADPNGVVEDVLSVATTAKSPKAVTASIQTLDSIFKEFGAPVTDPKPVLKTLPNFFGHTDRSVRQAATGLATSLSRWVGEPVLLQVLAAIKPVQLNELKASIAKADLSAPPPRLTRQQARQLEQQEANGNDSELDVADEGNHYQNAGQTEQSNIDPWDLLEPEEVVSRIPDDFWNFIHSTKWKERHETLLSISPILEKAKKMNPSSDYSRLINELLHVAHKDVNQMCTTQALQCLCYLALGLRHKYSPYSHNTLEYVIERFKEKKQSVIDVIVSTIDAVFLHVIDSQFGPILETVVNIGMSHKTPQVRIESTKCCAHILCESTVYPKMAQMQEVGAVAVKLLGDTNEAMRAAAASVLAALIKLVGDAKMASIMDPLDDHKKKRVVAALEKTTVKAKAAKKASPPPPQQAQSKSTAPPTTAAASQRRARPGADAGSKQQPATSSTRAPAQPQTSSRQPARSLAPPSAASARSLHNLTSPSRSRTSAHDVSMGLTSPSPMTNSSQRSGRPSLSSTPKIVKRTSTNADFTPARGVDTFRRRIYSPARPMGMGSPSNNLTGVEEEQADVNEIARLTAELELEKALRLEAEKRLARFQVEKDREVLRMQEEISMLKLQLKTQKEEFEVWLKNKERRWSQASVSSDDMGNRLSGLSLDAENPRPGSRPVSRRPPSRVLPIAASQPGPVPTSSVNTSSQRTGNDDWERAVSMTQSLRQRVEQLKQQKQRSMMP